ncbi:ferritin-like domain-containing protein [bacterium]|nr:ferritin-like domain-containing protein [bacterium]MBU1958706.1 ferritin-like domain-containing protein [bacterium]
MNIYKVLEEAITSDRMETKEKLTQQCFEYCSQNEFISSKGFQPLLFKIPSYANRCEIVEPKALKRRKDFDTSEGLAILVHSIAHIEYSAIDLALDAVYRYPSMPQAYKIDWLEVALDEIRHYKMLNELLEELGYNYGDFPVHCGLFDASCHTADDILDRMAIVPRYYEASGLDVNPQIIKKLENKRKIPSVQKLIEHLHLIYKEEIVHVQKGDYWFKTVCKSRDLSESVYFEILERYKLLDKHRPHVNVKARQEAGFTCQELEILGNVKCL